MQRQDAVRALETGLRMMSDESIRIPITYSEGIGDLIRLIKLLLTGEYVININPDRQAAADMVGDKSGEQS